ncbi:MAG: hypothetical protein NE328_11900 [Lentisphaeraceae bacterium]|nr:hypothetical protein [Lentisphaeraceae bacterium]
MKESIRKIILRLFPELKANLHVPVFGVVSSIPDPPEKNVITDSFRPYYSVNIKLLDEHFNEDPAQPELKAVPVAQMAAGQERGFSALPEPGSIVEIAFAYARQSKPFIRSVLPYRMNQPAIDSDAQRWQQNYDSFQEADGGGNWTRQTNGSITDDCAEHFTYCLDKLQTIVNEVKTVKAHSSENVSGIKKIIAGALKFLTAGTVSIGAADNANVTAGQHVNIACGVNSLFKTGGDRKVETTGDVEETTDGNVDIATNGEVNDITIGTHHKEALNWYIGNAVDSIPHLTAEFMQTVTEALQILETHTHPSVTKPSQENDIKNKRILTAAQKLRMDAMSE